MLVLADLVRKPYAYQAHQRGQTIRASDELPELSAESTKIRGTIALDGQPRPFDAQGRFLLASTVNIISETMPGSVNSSSGPLSGTDHWEMSVQQPDHLLKLEARSLSVDRSVAVHLTSSDDQQLELDCRVCDGVLAASEGQVNFPHWLGARQTHDSVATWCSGCVDAALMEQCVRECMIAGDATPETLRFVAHGPGASVEPSLDIDNDATFVDKKPAGTSRQSQNLRRIRSGCWESRPVNGGENEPAAELAGYAQTRCRAAFGWPVR